MKLLLCALFLTTTDSSLLPFDTHISAIQQALGVDNDRAIDGYIRDLGGEIFDKMENKSKKLKDVLLLKQMDVLPTEESGRNFSVFGKEDDSLEKQIMEERLDQDASQQNSLKTIV